MSPSCPDLVCGSTSDPCALSSPTRCTGSSSGHLVAGPSSTFGPWPLARRRQSAPMGTWNALQSMDLLYRQFHWVSQRRRPQDFLIAHLSKTVDS